MGKGENALTYVMHVIKLLSGDTELVTIFKKKWS